MVMNQREQSYQRILLIFGIVFGILLILAIQICRIQILDYGKFSRAANEQRQSVLLNNQLRGVFLDRHGRVLRSAKNRWYLVIERAVYQCRDLENLAAVLGTDFSGDFNKQPSQPFWIDPKLLTDTQIQLLNQLNLKGIKIIANISRYDAYNPLAWHLLGFVDRGHGFSGLEYLYDSLLEQRNTKEVVFTINDGRHHFIPGLGLRSHFKRTKAAVLLTLDRRIQQIAETGLDQTHRSGAIVILDARDGDILAMASRPLVNLDDLAASTIDHTDPFLNRAISAYHPGSVFKLVILAAGLNSGQVKADDLYFDPGYFETGAQKWDFTAAGEPGRGWLTLTEALAYSCNPVFIRMMLKLEPALVLNYADKFGLGQPCNIGLRDESWGGIPSELDLTIGDQVNAALGEGDIYTTPLQMASVVQTIANLGIRKTPRLVAGYINQAGLIKYLTPEPGTRVISPETAREIQKMMAAVVDFGTGTEAGVPGMSVAGKTGTAQSGNAVNSPEHAWFVGCIPTDHPRYVAAVFCEQGISGGKTAAPIFKEIMEQVIKLKD